MDPASEHVSIWTAISTTAGTCAFALFNLGRDWGRLCTQVRYMHENQQAIADRMGLVLLHPFVGETAGAKK